MHQQIIHLREWDALKHTLPTGLAHIAFVSGDQYRVLFTDGNPAVVDGFETIEVNAYDQGEIVLCYTDAPAAYDGFGTTPIKLIRQTRQGRDLRQVLILKTHLDWQANRYRSGLYVCLDQAKFNEMGDWL